MNSPVPLFEADDGAVFGKEEFVAALRGVGVHSGDTCFVHTDIRVFGRPKTTDWPLLLGNLEEALIESVGAEGTLIVPTFSYSFCKNETFDVEVTPGTVGVLNEHFRKRQDVRRSNHPIFSVAVWGNKRDKLRQVGDDSFGEDSIFGSLRQDRGKIVFLGASFQACTFVHYVEQAHGVPYRYMKSFFGTVIENGCARDTQCTYLVRYLDANVVLDLARLERSLLADGLMRRILLGEGQVLIVSALDLFDRAYSMLDGDIFSLLREPPRLPNQHERS